MHMISQARKAAPRHRGTEASESRHLDAQHSIRGKEARTEPFPFCGRRQEGNGDG
jgi:hypothetical protein